MNEAILAFHNHIKNIFRTTTRNTLDYSSLTLSFSLQALTEQRGRPRQLPDDTPSSVVTELLQLHTLLRTTTTLPRATHTYINSNIFININFNILYLKHKLHILLHCFSFIAHRPSLLCGEPIALKPVKCLSVHLASLGTAAWLNPASSACTCSSFPHLINPNTPLSTPTRKPTNRKRIPTRTNNTRPPNRSTMEMTTSLAPNSRTTECGCKTRATHADVGTHATPTTRKLQHNTNNMGANCSTNPHRWNEVTHAENPDANSSG